MLVELHVPHASPVTPTSTGSPVWDSGLLSFPVVVFVFMFMVCEVFRRIEVLFYTFGVTRHASVYSRQIDKGTLIVHNDERILSVRKCCESIISLVHLRLIHEDKETVVGTGTVCTIQAEIQAGLLRRSAQTYAARRNSTVLRGLGFPRPIVYVVQAKHRRG
jgi:hypothetical protein